MWFYDHIKLNCGYTITKRGDLTLYLMSRPTFLLFLPLGSASTAL